MTRLDSFNGIAPAVSEKEAVGGGKGGKIYSTYEI
jgi:hypothetical protein